MNEENLKIGIYTEDEIFNYMTEQEGGMLGRSMYDAIFDKMHALITETERLKKDKLILKEKLEASEKARKEAIEFIKEYEKNQNLLKWNEEDYIDVINEIKKYLDIDKGE